MICKVPLSFTYSQDLAESSTPSSKRVYTSIVEDTEQSSSSKKLCVQAIEFENSKEECVLKAATLNFDATIQDEIEKNDDVEIIDNKVQQTKLMEVKVKLEKKE